MEQYYLPLSVTQPADITKIGVEWRGDNYRIFNNCPNEFVGDTLPYVELDRYGYIRDTGSTEISSSTCHIVGVGCSVSDNQVSTAQATNSLLDIPVYTPFSPIYFVIFLCLTVSVFVSAFRFVFGRRLG